MNTGRVPHPCDVLVFVARVGNHVHNAVILSDPERSEGESKDLHFPFPV